MNYQTYGKNEVVFEQGQLQEWMYSIVRGSVSIYMNYGHKDEKKLTTLEAGAYFGELGLIDYFPRSATAVAEQDDTQLEMVTIENLLAYLKAHPENTLKIMQNISSRIRSVSNDLLEVRRVAADILREKKSAPQKSGWLSQFLGKFTHVLSTGWEPKCAPYQVLGESNGNIGVFENYPAGSVVFRQGDAAACMYDIYWGRVGIYDSYGTPQEKQITVIENEMVFGELGLLENLPRSATAVCLEPCKMRVITMDTFNSFFQESPVKVVQIMRQMTGRLRDLTQEYKATCRMLADAMEKDSRGQAPDDSFWDTMDQFRSEYNAACQYAAEIGMDMSGFGYYNW